MSPADYRELFELPATKALMAGDLRDALAERGSVLIATHERVRLAFQVDDPDASERLERLATGRKNKRSTQARAGVQRGKQQVGQLLAADSRRRSARRREQLDEAARTQGYADLESMAKATTTLSHAEFGVLVGLKPDAARAWRRHFGVTSQVQASRAAAHRASWRNGLEEVPHGVQPEQGGALRCLECGLWKVDLAQHLAGTHTMSAEVYRLKFALGPDCPLRGAQLRQQDQQLAQRSRAAGEVAGRIKSEQVRQAYDQQAQLQGFTSVVELLRTCTTPEVARHLGVSPQQANRLRRRYLAQGGRGQS
jgi:predicted transcriptional regulator